MALYLTGGLLFYLSLGYFRYGFGLNMLLILALGYLLYVHEVHYLGALGKIILPLVGVNMLVVLIYSPGSGRTDRCYTARLRIKSGILKLQNIRRGVSIIGSAGSGKTESVVYGFLKHFQRHQFCGVIHDYKHFEISEIAWPLFKERDIPFHIISFDDIHKRVNPIAPRYMVDEESVNEVSRVLLENLLEQRETFATGSSKFFNDAVEGLLGGLIWKLKTSHPQYCTLPHLIAAYQYLDTKNLIKFLSSDITAKGMADAFISGKASDRQTAGVMGTLANALKKISTQRIFMTLSADEIDLDINNPKNPAVISVVNNPKYETAYSPVIATVIHTIVKQMSIRGQKPSFLLMEEASTIRLLNMHRIPATLRGYDISTVYVMQDKVQNDLMYGERASRAILGNLSYQFFGKANDPETTKYYERFFEIVKRPTRSVSQSSRWDWDTRVTKGEKEVSKIRSDEFFRLNQGEFISFADGRDRKVRFRTPKVKRELPEPSFLYDAQEIEENYKRIHREAREIFKFRKP
nr:type IV secretory system conjugative DNA transfer family protein [Allomuricauda ochracea]